MNLLNELSSSVKLPDVALKTSWVLVPEPIKMIYKPQWMQSGQGWVKIQRGEVGHAMELVEQVKPSIWVSWLHTCHCNWKQRDGVERGEAKRKEARSTAKLGYRASAFYFYKPRSCLSCLHPTAFLCLFRISASLFSRVTALPAAS